MGKCDAEESVPIGIAVGSVVHYRDRRELNVGKPGSQHKEPQDGFCNALEMLIGLCLSYFLTFTLKST